MQHPMEAMLSRAFPPPPLRKPSSTSRVIYRSHKVYYEGSRPGGAATGPASVPVSHLRLASERGMPVPVQPRRRAPVSAPEPLMPTAPRRREHRLPRQLVPASPARTVTPGRVHGWKLAFAAGEDVELQRCGMHTLFSSGVDTSVSVALHVPTSNVVAEAASPGFRVELGIKAASPHDPKLPAQAAVVVGFEDPSRPFVVVLADTSGRVWRIEAYPDAKSLPTCMASYDDPTLRPNAFVGVSLEWGKGADGGDSLSLSVKGRPIFKRVSLAPSSVTVGGVGVATRASRMVVKDVKVVNMEVPSTALEPPAGRVLQAASGAVVTSKPALSTAPTGGGPPPPAAPPLPPSIDPALGSVIERDIVPCTSTSFEDIVALDDAKRLLNESVVLPLLVPEMYTGIRTPWRGILLFGAPGTGKTMLARAVAGAAGTTFFNVSASTLVSKWRGESEKLVRTLFDMARLRAPSIVFIDEVDALGSSRGSASEHEASRRLKAELLSQMDGMASTAGASVMVLATTNHPWDLDDALRRRFEKRILVPLPGLDARRAMLESKLGGVSTDDSLDMGAMAAATDGFSGADIHVLCREASMAPMRRLLQDKSPADVARMRAAGELTTPPVTQADLEAGLAATRPSVGKADLAKFDAWHAEFGST